MIANKNLIFSRVLAVLMVLVLLVPTLCILIPLAVSASDALDGNEPTVSLSWDESTVSVTDGVATPSKNTSDTAYTMSCKVTVKGEIDAPITVRIESFDLSAKAGQEYAKVDTTVTFTEEEATTKTLPVTVYVHTGYASKVYETGRIYTNEFGLRITDISGAKKESGKDTLRAQVLSSDDMVLTVSKNSSAKNYAGGHGSFGGGYVYTALTKDYTQKIIESVRVKPSDDQADISFNPYQLLIGQKDTDMPALLALYPYMKVYYNGTGQITEDSHDKTRYGFFIRLKENGTIVFEQNQHAQKTWDKWSFNWLTYGYANDYHDHPNKNGDFNVINTSVSAYHRSSSYGDRYLIQQTKTNVVISLNTCNNDWNLSGKNYHDFWVGAMAAESTPVVAESYYIEDRVYGSGDTVYLTVRFNKPVQIENDAAHPLKIQTKIGGSLANYFTYCGGTMTDTLIFSMTLPENADVNGNNIELVGFENEDYNKNIGDLLWNTANQNNMYTLSDSTVSGRKFACTVDTRTPTVLIHSVVGNSGIVKSGSFMANVTDITNQGKIEIAWTKSETPPTSFNSLEFFPDSEDKASVLIEGIGLTGVYYAHLRVTGISGNQTLTTEGPFCFDNQAPSITDIHLANGDNAQMYRSEHTVEFDVADDFVGLDKVYLVYLVARDSDEGFDLSGDAEELLVYDSTKIGSLLTVTDGKAQIALSASMLGLADDSYGAYKIGFRAIDKLGNESKLTEFSEKLMFDNRDAFEASLDSTADISICGRHIFFNGRTISFLHGEAVGSDFEILTLFYNGQNIADNLSENGFVGTQDNANRTYTLELMQGTAGYVEVVFSLNGERVSSVINFYVTDAEARSNNYSALYAPDRLLINEVWQLSDSVFYTGSNRNGSYYVGANIKPIFSSREKALEYVKFFEKQDIVIEYIDDEVEKNNLEGGWLSNYRKADADRNKVAEVGQTWLRYKSNAWTAGSNNEEHWVYYFYSDERESVIDPILTPSLNDAIDRCAKLICTYDGDGRIYLSANNTSKGYVNSNSEPYYDARGILKSALTYQGIFSYELSILADSGIYDSFVSYGEMQVPLAKSYKFILNSSKNEFVYLRQYGTEKWTVVLNGESFKDKLTASGLYEICEFANGYTDYFVYVDLDAPVIAYDITVDGVSKSGHITKSTSGGTLRASRFNVNELVDTVYGSLAVERDRWAYFYVLYSTLGSGEHAFLTMNELNREGYELSTGIYKIYACDRLGNMSVQTVRINTEDIKVTDTVSTTGLTVTSNRAPTDIAQGSFKVYRDNMLLPDEIYAQTMTFTKSGEYLIEFEDVYGNKVSEHFSFRRDLPVVSFYREKAEGTGRYEQIAVNADANGNLSQVVSADNQLFTVSTASNIRISYPISSGYAYEFLGDAPKFDTSTLSSTTSIDISKETKNWTLKISHRNDSNVYILITCTVDNDAPTLSGTVYAKEYTYDDASGSILFAPTQNTVQGFFHNGERAVGSSAVISWNDATGVKSVSYTKDGGAKIPVSASFGSLTVSMSGQYVFEAEDIFGNKAIFSFTLTDHIDFDFMMGGVKQTVEYEPEKYLDGDRYTHTLYTGKEARLVLKENALVALSYNDGSESYICHLSYEVNGGVASLTVSVYDATLGEFITEEDDKLILTASGTVISGAGAINYTYQNGEVALVIPECMQTYELWQMRVSDFTGHSPVVIQVERSDRLSEFEISKADGTTLDLTYNGFIGSNRILQLMTQSVSADTESIVAYYSRAYTQDFSQAEKITLFGVGANPTLDKEGYYKIVATNKYSNERVIFVAISFTLSLDAHIHYDSLDSRTQTLTRPDSYSLYTNKSVSITVWDIRASVSAKRGEDVYALSVSEKNGYLEFTIADVGSYTVTVSDGCENLYTLNISVEAKKTLAYGDFLYGFNQNAMKRDEGYTNGTLSLDKSKIEASGVKYIAYRKAGSVALTVLYDLIDINNPKGYSAESFNNSIGKEDGVYEIIFADAYGNPHTERVNISRSILLSIKRQTQSSRDYTDYDLDLAIEYGAWSNYSLLFINSSEKYLLKINGIQSSFDNGSYTFTLPSGLGATESSYTLSFTDDFGNTAEIKVCLYRYVPESSIKEGADTLTSAGTQYVRGNFSLVFGDDVVATYSLNGGAKIAFDKEFVFDRDGSYTFTFTDRAGNTASRLIVRDATVSYDMSSDGFILNSGVIVSSRVTLSPDEELTFTVTKNGVDYPTEARSFNEDGVYKVTLTDRIGNTSHFEFTIFQTAKKSFGFTAPDGYSISQVWYTADGHRLSLAGDVSLDSAGVSSFSFLADGEYEVELLHLASDKIFYFKVIVDNTPPEAVLVGAENGGVTRDAVSIEELKSGDRIIVYKNGALLTSYIVNGTSKTTLELLDSGDLGEYTVVIEDEAGNATTFEFTKVFATNTFSNIFICLILIAFGAVGIIYIRFNGKVRTK